ncbi:Virulence protein [Bacteroidales bacterium Barb7]|nr:Virulence protein [Bacteroidales bacterium Barb7]
MGLKSLAPSGHLHNCFSTVKLDIVTLNLNVVDISIENEQIVSHFDIWANRILKDYLIKGYAISQRVKREQLNDLKQTVKLLSNVIQHKELTAVEATGLLQVIADYTYALDTFKGSISTIYQTFDGVDLYPSVEEKAARIAAFLFLWFLERNGVLYKDDGSRLIENNTLVALTLMIAESQTEEKDIMAKVIVNLINKNN